MLRSNSTARNPNKGKRWLKMLTLLNRIPIEKVLKISAITIFIARAIVEVFFIKSMLRQHINSFDHSLHITSEELVSIMSALFYSIINILYHPLVLLGLAELIKINKGKDK